MATQTGSSAGSARALPRVVPRVVLSVVTAAGLIVDGVIHLRLAADRDAIGGTLSEGRLFRVEAAVAFLAALLVLVLPWRRIAYGVAFVVAASALGAVVLYRYVNVGAIGPLPNMYEPIWYGEKTLSAIAELVAMVVAAVGLAGTIWRRRVR
jgi:hypothetical protein